MLPLVVVFPISFSSAPYMQFPPPGFSCSGTSAISTIRNGSMPPCARSRSAPPRRCSPWRSACRWPSPGARALRRPPAGRSAGAGAAGRADHHPVGRPVRPVRQAEADRRMVRAGRSRTPCWRCRSWCWSPWPACATSTARWSRRPRGWAPAALQTLLRVTLPLLRPSLVSAGLLAFITSFDELVVALFLAGPNMTLPKKMFDNIMMEIDPDDRRGVGDADPAGLDRARPDRSFRARAAAAARAERECHG